MRRRERLAGVGVVVALAIAVLVVGGALRWTQALVAGVAACALLPFLASRRDAERTSPLLRLLGVACALTAIQLLPLPAAVVAWLDPVGAGLRADGAAIAGTQPWSALSMDPPATLRALAYFLTLTALALAGVRIAHSERGRYALLACVAGVIGLAAVVVGGHHAVGATSLYGVYAPLEATPPLLGPLLNPNHLGCLMAIGATVALGLALHHRQSSARRIGWGVIAVIDVLVLLAAASRGAMLAVIAGLVVTSIAVATQHLHPATRGSSGRRSRFMFQRLPIAIVILCSLFVLVYTSGSQVVGQLEDTSLSELHDPRSKFAAWNAGLELVGESPWVGVGRGAVEPTLTRIHPATRFVSISHVENEYVQILIDYGVPGTLLLAGCAWLFGAACIRRWRDGPLSAGALGALVVVATQSIVDFGIQLPGIGVPITLIAATLCPAALTELPPHRRWVPRVRAGALAAATLLVGATLLLPWTRSVQEDHRALAGRPPRPLIDETIARHPLDYLGYAKAAEALFERRDPAAVRFLNHSLQLHPTHVGLHRLAARMLVRAGRPLQAAGEYERALRGATDPTVLIDEITTVLSPAEATAAIPTDYENPKLVVKALVARSQQATAIAWLTRRLEERPRDAVTARFLYDLALAAGDLDHAELAATRRLELTASLEDRIALATILEKRQDHRQLITVLGDLSLWRSQGRTDQVTAAWLMLCDAHLSLEELGESLRCLHLLQGAGVLDARAGARVMERIDKVRQRQQPR